MFKKFKTLFIILLIAGITYFITSCAQPQTPNEKIAYANSLIAAASKSTQTLYQSKKISKDTAIKVYQILKGAAQELDLAQKYYNSNNMTAFNLAIHSAINLTLTANNIINSSNSRGVK